MTHIKPSQPLFWSTCGVLWTAVPCCSCLKRAHKDSPNWTICLCTLHTRQQNLWSSITDLLDRREPGGAQQRHIVGIPLHQLKLHSYFCRSMFQAHITPFPIGRLWNISTLSSLSWLGVSSHLWPLSPLTFSRGQRRSGVSGLAIVSNEQDSVCLILKTSWTDSSSTSQLQQIYFFCAPQKLDKCWIK